MVKKAKPAPGVFRPGFIDAEAMDVGDLNINVEGVMYPSDVFEDTAGLTHPLLDVKLRCQTHLKSLTCPDGKRCLRVHFLPVTVLRDGKNQRVSAGHFQVTCGLLHFLDNEDDRKSGWPCRDEEGAGCHRKTDCTFLHRFDSVTLKRQEAERQLNKLKAQIAAANKPPVVTDDATFPTLGEVTVSPKKQLPPVAQAAQPAASSTTWVPKPQDTAPAAVKAAAPAPPRAVVEPPTLQVRVGQVPVFSAAATFNSTSYELFTPSPPTPAPHVDSSVISAFTTKFANAAIATSAAPPPAGGPGTFKIARRVADEPPPTTRPTPNGYMPPQYSGAPVSGFDYTGSPTFAPPSFLMDPRLPQQQHYNHNSQNMAPWLTPNFWEYQPPQSQNPFAADASTNNDLAEYNARVQQARYTLRVAPDMFGGSRMMMMSAEEVVKVLKDTAEQMAARRPSDAVFGVLEATLLSLTAECAAVALTYMTTLSPQHQRSERPSQQLLDFAEALRNLVVREGCIGTHFMSTLLSRFMSSQLQSAAIELVDIMDLVTTCYDGARELKGALEKSLDRFSMLELFFVGANVHGRFPRAPQSRFSASTRDGIALEISDVVSRNNLTHDAEMKKFASALIQSLADFGADADCEFFVTNSLRQAHWRVQRHLKPILQKDASANGDSHGQRSFESLLFLLEQTTCETAMRKWSLRRCLLVDRTNTASMQPESHNDAQVYPVSAPNGSVTDLWLIVEIDPRNALAFTQWLPELFIGQRVTVNEEESSLTWNSQVSKRRIRFVIRSIGNHRMLIAKDKYEDIPQHWRPSSTELRIEVEHNRWHLDNMILCMRAASDFLTWADEKTAPSVKRQPAADLSRLPYRLDDEQQRFVRHVTTRPRLTILMGPPGTGKTHSIVAAIDLIVTKGLGRVLALATNNFAANLLATHLIQSQIDVLRVFTRSVSPLDIRNGPFAHLLSCSNPVISSDTRQRIAPDRFGFDSEFENATREDLTSHAVICTTTAHCSWMSQTDFAFVFVDEAAQATFAEPLAPLQFTRPDTSIILAGDPSQLGPSILNDIATEEGLGRSLLERLQEAKDTGVDKPYELIMLRHGYRNHPKILKLFNDLFYFGQLIPAADSIYPIRSSIVPRPDLPIVFVDVASSNPLLQSYVSTSTLAAECYDSAAEADAVAHIVERLLIENEDRRTLCRGIGIITPFRQQVLTITKRLAALKHKETEDILVGTVDQYQGQERSVIIVSLVRSTRDSLIPGSRTCVGLVGNRAKTNVAISRAETMLVIVGELGPLTRLPATEPWRCIADFVRTEGLVITPQHVKRPAHGQVPATITLDAAPAATRKQAASVAPTVASAGEW